MQIRHFLVTQYGIDVGMPVNGEQDFVCRSAQDVLYFLGVVDGPGTGQWLMRNNDDRTCLLYTSDAADE